jgi:hypothetical protein
MTAELVEILQQDPSTYFYVAVVEKIRDDGLLDLVIGNVGDPDPNVARYQGVAYLDSYLPQVYDKVFFMTHQTRKSLVFGKAHDSSTTAMSQPRIPLRLAPGWELVRGRAARRAGIVVMNAEFRSPSAQPGNVVGTVTDRRHRPQEVPAALSWVSRQKSVGGGGTVDDVTGEIALNGAVPENDLILVSTVWDSIEGVRHGQ